MRIDWQMNGVRGAGRASALSAAVIAGMVGAAADARATPPVLHGKDVPTIIRVTETEGPQQQMYIGRRIADIGTFWAYKPGGEGIGRGATRAGPTIEFVSFDANLHPSYTDSVFLACPVAADSRAARVAAAWKKGDALRFSGAIEDVAGGPTPDEPQRTVITLKPGCVVLSTAP